MPTINGKACVANGRNLYTDTKNFENLASWKGSNSWTKATDTYNGLAVMQTTQDWSGLSQYVQVKKGDILTYSVYAKNISGTGTSNIFWTLKSQTEGSYSSSSVNPYWNSVAITDSWQRVSGTVVATSDGYLRPRLERTSANTNTLQIAGIKVEKGSTATPLAPAPVDKVFSNGKQVYGRNLLTNSRTAQGWNNYSKWTVADDKYNGLTVFKRSDLWGGLYQLLKISSSPTTYTWSAWAKEDEYGVQNPSAIWVACGALDKNGNVLATGGQYISSQITSVWNRVFFTLSESDIPAGTDSIFIRSEKTDTNGKYWYIAGIKIESGDTATPYSPAPEDVI